MAATLAESALVLASDVTLIECDRVLIRAVALSELREADAVQRQARLNAVSAHWTLFALDEEIVERARRPFPAEPIRTLDAIHLATALVARKAIPDVALLSLDNRIREAGGRLGFRLLPADSDLEPGPRADR